MPRVSAEKVVRVAQLLAELFTIAEFRRQVVAAYERLKVLDEAVSDKHPRADYFFEIAAAADRNELLQDGTLLTAVVAVRRGRAGEINSLLQSMKVETAREDSDNLVESDKVARVLYHRRRGTTLGIVVDHTLSLNGAESGLRAVLKDLGSAVASLGQGDDPTVRTLLWLRRPNHSGGPRQTREPVSDGDIRAVRECLGINKPDVLPHIEVIDDKEAFLHRAWAFVSVGDHQELRDMAKSARVRPIWRPWLGLPDAHGRINWFLEELRHSIYGPTVKALAAWNADQLIRGSLSPDVLAHAIRSCMLLEPPEGGTFLTDVRDMISDLKQDRSAMRSVRLGLLGILCAVGLMSVGGAWLAYHAGTRTAADTIGVGNENLKRAKAALIRTNPSAMFSRWFADISVDLSHYKNIRPEISSIDAEIDELTSKLLDALPKAPADRKLPNGTSVTQWNYSDPGTEAPSLKMIRFVWESAPQTSDRFWIGSTSSAKNPKNAPKTKCIGREYRNASDDKWSVMTISPITGLSTSSIAGTKSEDYVENSQMFSEVICLTAYASEPDEMPIAKVAISPYNLIAAPEKDKPTGGAGVEWYVGRKGSSGGDIGKFRPIIDEAVPDKDDYRRVRIPDDPLPIPAALLTLGRPGPDKFVQGVQDVVQTLCAEQATSAEDDTRLLVERVTMLIGGKSVGCRSGKELADGLALAEDTRWFTPEPPTSVSNGLDTSSIVSGQLRREEGLWYIFMMGPSR